MRKGTLTVKLKFKVLPDGLSGQSVAGEPVFPASIAQGNTFEVDISPICDTRKAEVKYSLVSNSLESVTDTAKIYIPASLDAYNIAFKRKLVQSIIYCATERERVWATIDYEATRLFTGIVDLSNLTIQSYSYQGDIELVLKDNGYLLDEKIAQSIELPVQAFPRFNSASSPKTKGVYYKDPDNANAFYFWNGSAWAHKESFSDTESKYFHPDATVRVWSSAVVGGELVESVVGTLLGMAGYSVSGGTIDPSASDTSTSVVRCFTYDMSEDKTYKEVLDTLLKEYRMCLTFTPEGKVRIVSLSHTSIHATRDIGYGLKGTLGRRDGIKTTFEASKKDGVKLKYSSGLAVRREQSIYSENLGSEFDENGELKGTAIKPQQCLPETGDITATYQEYNAKFLDRAYTTKVNRKENEDLSIISTHGHHLEVAQKGGTLTYPAFTVGESAEHGTGANPYFMPKKAQVLFRNDYEMKNKDPDSTEYEEEAESHSIYLQIFNIVADVLYRDKTTTIYAPSATANPETYESTYLFDDGPARAFANFYLGWNQYGAMKTDWTEYKGTVDTIGSIIGYQHTDSAISSYCLLSEETISFTGSPDVPFVIKMHGIGIAPYNDKPVQSVSYMGDNKNRGANGATGPKGETGASGTDGRGIASVAEYYMLSDQQTAPSVSDSAWNATPQTPTTTKPYLWKKTVVSYTSGSPTVSLSITGRSVAGWSQATLQLFKRSATTPAKYDGSALTYTFSTATLAGNKGSWSITIPSGADPLYVIYAPAFGQGETDVVEPSDWTVPAILSKNGTQGEKGDPADIQYCIWPDRDVPPVENDTFLLDGKLITISGNPINNPYAETIWENRAPDKVPYGYYAWMRTRAGKDALWSCFRLTPDQSLDFSLQATATIVTCSGRYYVHDEQTISVFVSLEDMSNLSVYWDVKWKDGTNDGLPSWAQSEDKRSCTIEFSFSTHLKKQNLVVSCAVMGLRSRSIEIQVVPESANNAIFLGEDWDETNEWTPNGDRIEKGDYYYHKDTQEPWVYDGTKWAAATSSTTTLDMLREVGNWVLSNGERVTNETSSIYGYFRNLFAQKASIDELQTQVITSRNYREDENGFPTNGYKLDGPNDLVTSYGMKADGGEFHNVYISGGDINIENSDGELVFQTNRTPGGTDYDVSGPATTKYFSVDELIENLPRNVIHEVAVSCEIGVSSSTGTGIYINDTSNHVEIIPRKEDVWTQTLAMKCVRRNGDGTFNFSGSATHTGPNTSYYLKVKCSQIRMSLLRITVKNSAGTILSVIERYDVPKGIQQQLWFSSDETHDWRNPRSADGNFTYEIYVEENNVTTSAVVGQTTTYLRISFDTHGYSMEADPRRVTFLNQAYTNTDPWINFSLSLGTYVLGSDKQATIGARDSSKMLFYNPASEFLSLIPKGRYQVDCTKPMSYSDGTVSLSQFTVVSISSAMLRVTSLDGDVVYASTDYIKGVPTLKFSTTSILGGAAVLNLSASTDTSQIGTVSHKFADVWSSKINGVNVTDAANEAIDGNLSIIGAINGLTGAMGKVLHAMMPDWASQSEKLESEYRAKADGWLRVVYFVSANQDNYVAIDGKWVLGYQVSRKADYSDYYFAGVVPIASGQKVLINGNCRAYFIPMIGFTT